MEKLIVLVSWIVSEGPTLLGSLIGVLTSLIAFFLLIPGEQPEKALKKAVEFLSKYSRK
jgi:hypothetical protein